MSFTRITPEAFCQIRNPVVIDVRTAAECASIHLPEACNIALQDITADSVHKQCPDKEATVYLLCGMGKRAQMAAEKIAGEVERPLVIIEGGIQALQQQNITLNQQTGGVISIERQVRIAAGLLVLTGVVLGALIAPAFYGLAGFVGAGLTFAGITDTCAMGLLLTRMPWNQRA